MKDSLKVAIVIPKTSFARARAYCFPLLNIKWHFLQWPLSNQIILHARTQLEHAKIKKEKENNNFMTEIIIIAGQNTSFQC